MRLLIVASAAALTVAACAPQPSSEMGSGGMAQASATGRQCFNAETVNGFQEVSERVVDLNVSGQEIYRAETFGLCPDLDNAVGLGIRTRSGGRFVCSDMDLELVVPSVAGGPRTCLVRSLRRLSPAEIEAARRDRS